MARTQAADYEQRQEAILEKAAQLFAKGGFKGTSVADLALACKTSKSLIYHYYPSKEDILYAVMASHVDQLEIDVAGALATGDSPTERLSLLVHGFMRHYVGAASRQKVLLNELDSLPADKRKAIVLKQRSIVDAVASLLSQISGGGDATALRVRAMLLFGMINWTHTWYDPHGSLKPDAIADLALELILRDGSRTIG
jgi:AcrR family transcriptional regulator